LIQKIHIFDGAILPLSSMKPPKEKSKLKDSIHSSD